MAKSERRPQAGKNRERTMRVQGIRQSNAAGIHSGQGEYRRMKSGQLNQLVWEELEETWDYSYSDDWK